MGVVPHSTVAWRGDFDSVHSLAVVNDVHTAALEAAGWTVERLAAEARPTRTDAVGVAGQWPPRFTAPSQGPFVLYQPWEFGCVPACWTEEIRARVDEVWTPSSTARSSYLAAGIAPELVQVVPNGVDLERFRPDGPALDLGVEAGTTFLFVGGATYRKGIDLLLSAWLDAFGADDDVALVIKGFGSGNYYFGQTAGDRIRAVRETPGAAPVVFFDEDVAFDAMPALYRGADVLVQPYRGEGFCLPALEALASGLPVVVTAGGPTDDFVSEDCAWRVASRRIPLPKGTLPDELRPGGEAYLLETEHDALVDALRAAADPAAKAARAREHALPFGLAEVGAIAAGRLEALAGRQPVRSVAPAVVPGRRGLLLAVAADWDREDTWAPAVRAYTETFTAADDTTLVLPVEDEGRAAALVTALLERLDLPADALPDLALADTAAVGPVALELAADAVVAAPGHHPARARRVVAPNPAALRALVLDR